MANTDKAFGTMAYCRGVLNTLTPDIEKAKIALDSREPDDIALDIGLAEARLEAALFQLIKARKILQSVQGLIKEEVDDVSVPGQRDVK